MPIERELGKILAMPVADLIQWRADVRAVPAERRDARLSALYEASGREVVKRADAAWPAAATG